MLGHYPAYSVSLSVRPNDDPDPPFFATPRPKQLYVFPAKTPISMQSREEIVATLQRLKGEIAARFSVSRIGIFGSVARGEQTEASDIDILVEFSRPIGFFTFLELEEFLSLNLSAPVDLVTSDALKPIIRERVTAEVAYV